MIRCLIADSQPRRREQIRAALAPDPDIEIVALARDGQEALAIAHGLRPDIALLATDLALGDGFVTAELLAASALVLPSILLSEEVRADDLRRAMRAGAREHLTWPLVPEELCDAVRQVCAESRRRLSPAFAAAADPGLGTRVFAISGAKGGIGKTTLAVNLAVALAAETGEPTALLDLYTQFGDTALLLNLTPRRSVADLARLEPAEIDERLLEDHLERHESGVSVLAGAATPLALDALSPECLDRILGLLRQSHHYLVLDVPPVLHATTLHALSHATLVLLIANLFDLTTLADSRLWLEALIGRYVSGEALRVVLNRVSPHNRLQIPDIERTLGCPAHALVPNDGKLVPASVNTGKPFVLTHPQSRVAQSLFALARSLVAGPAPISLPPAPTEPSGRSAFTLPLRAKGIDR